MKRVSVNDGEGNGTPVGTGENGLAVGDEATAVSSGFPIWLDSSCLA